jgi:hypothetical protein
MFGVAASLAGAFFSATILTILRIRRLPGGLPFWQPRCTCNHAHNAQNFAAGSTPADCWRTPISGPTLGHAKAQANCTTVYYPRAWACRPRCGRSAVARLQGCAFGYWHAGPRGPSPRLAGGSAIRAGGTSCQPVARRGTAGHHLLCQPAQPLAKLTAATRRFHSGPCGAWGRGLPSCAPLRALAAPPRVARQEMPRSRGTHRLQSDLSETDRCRYCAADAHPRPVGEG